MASQYNDSRSFSVNAAMSAFRRVAVSNNGYIGYAAIAVKGVGILQRDCTADSFENPEVRLYSAGTQKIAITAAPITVGDAIYAVTNGMGAVTNGANGGTTIGIALESAASNGDIIEFLPQFI